MLEMINVLGHSAKRRCFILEICVHFSFGNGFLRYFLSAHTKFLYFSVLFLCFWILGKSFLLLWYFHRKDKYRLEQLKQLVMPDGMEDAHKLLQKTEEEWCLSHNLVQSSLNQVALACMSLYCYKTLISVC